MHSNSYENHEWCISREYRKLIFVNNLKVKSILSNCNWNRKCE